jgi:hypothetical protein
VKATSRAMAGASRTEYCCRSIPACGSNRIFICPDAPGRPEPRGPLPSPRFRPPGSNGRYRMHAWNSRRRLGPTPGRQAAAPLVHQRTRLIIRAGGFEFLLNLRLRFARTHCLRLCLPGNAHTVPFAAGESVDCAVASCQLVVLSRVVTANWSLRFACFSFWIAEHAEWNGRECPSFGQVFGRLCPVFFKFRI